MAAISAVNQILHRNALSIRPISPNCCEFQTLALQKSQSVSSLENQCSRSKVAITNRKPRYRTVVFAAQNDILKVLQTAWKVGKDGIEAGTDLVPGSVPRPFARIGVGVVVSTVALFVLKSFLSTAFFVLGMMGLIYFVFIALNKDEGPKGGGGGRGVGASGNSTDDSLEEARRIMEKYK